MPESYRDRLNAIRIMLNDSFYEAAGEEYDLLFELWLENTDSSDFNQDLIPIAVEHEGIIQELKNRLEILIIKDEITDMYLQQRLKFLDSEVSKFKINSLKNKESITDSISNNKNETENLKAKFALWQFTLLVIIIVAVGLTIFLPNTYQKIGVLIIAVSSAIVFPYIFSQKHRTITTKITGIKLNYSFQKYLSVGDENTIDLSIENSNESEFSGAITLVFNDNDSLITPVANQSMSAKVEVPSFGREARQFKFILKKEPPNGNANYYFQVFSSDGLRFKTNNEFFLISPIPYLRSIWGWVISGSGLVALIITFLWEIFVDGK